MKYGELVLEGLGNTLLIFAVTLITSIPLGLLVALGRLSRHGWLKKLLGAYISVMRGTPLMLQLIAVLYLPSMIFKVPMDRYLAAFIAFTINYAAYFGEIFRGGIQSIERGQYEAASVLGFSKRQTFSRIILPQTVKRVLPATANEVITLVKDTSLAQVVAIVEMFTIAKQHMSGTGSVIPLLAAGVFYYILNLLVTVSFSYAEKKLSYYR
ncbi:MAG: amino acid ABC transporter permease [Christensenellaceae bacterium]|nr:amino acid ABC transporter permease [Christensenellaceae bacterium]MBS6565162.1 amino acid ABC transporter permease [Clostridiales bacterium]PWL97157.1 MAG: polar amino acid ABC transporter permease [Selenomonadales bacterium]